jgi:hypothetical protein
MELPSPEVRVLLMLGFVVLIAIGWFCNPGRMYDEARRDPRREGRYALVQARVTRLFFEKLRAGDVQATLYLACWIGNLLIILALVIL